MMEPRTQTSEAPPKGRVPRAERERQILAQAESVFARRGFEAASMEEIARASGVDRALVYQYFGGKSELYEACFTNALNGVTEYVARAIQGFKAVEETDEAARDRQFRDGIRAFFEFVQDHGDGWDVLFGAGWSAMGLARDDSAVNRDMLAWVDGILAVSYPHADETTRKARAAHLLGASWAVSLWWRKDGTLSLDEITEQHKDFCEAVLKPLERR